MNDPNTIETLRAHLFNALEGVKQGTLDLERARAVNELAKTIVDTARVEVDYLKAIDGDQSTFMEGATGPALPDHSTTTTTNPAQLPNGISSITRHTLRG
jgi:hypothetical protein